MKRRPATSRPAAAPRRAGKSARAKRPASGWKPRTLTLGWRNPRTPAVPATLHIDLPEYYAASALMGVIASQGEEPDQQWCRDWSFRMGEMMAQEAHRRRRKLR